MFDLRPYIKGLDQVGTGVNILTGERTSPLFEWSVPAWYKPSYDSGRYNYEFKIPEEILLTSLPSGESGMVTELYESFDQYESKQSFSTGINFGAFGATNALALSRSTERLRSSFQNFQVGISKQQYSLYELTVKPEIMGNCPYTGPVFSAEKDQVSTSSARPEASDGVVASWSAAQVGAWLKEIKLAQFAGEFVKRGVTGPLLLTLSSEELSELGLKSHFDRHKFEFELSRARKREVPSATAEEDSSSSSSSSSTGGGSSSSSSTGGGSAAATMLLDEEAGAGQAKDRFLRKWVMRQSFIDAVNSLPVLNDIGKTYCLNIDDIAEVEPDDAYDAGQDDETGAAPSNSPAENEKIYRRFLHDWGTHWARTVVMGGEVEVTTMIRKTTDTAKQTDASSTEANLENAEDSKEAETDDSAGTETTVDESDGAATSKQQGGGGDAATAAAASGAGASSSSDTTVEQPTTAKTRQKHTTTKSTRSSNSPMKAAASVVGTLASAVAAAGSSGASWIAPLIKSAISNLELKMSVSSKGSSSMSSTLTSGNNKNEVSFRGGDTAVDPQNVGGLQFANWKDSIKEDPAPIAKTMAPITELILAFAGPNAGEKCPAARIHLAMRRRATMLDCMTRKVIREGAALADTNYEIEQVTKKKTALEAEIGGGSEKTTQEWVALCKMRLNLLTKRDFQHHRLHSFELKAPIASSNNYGRMCDRELAVLTGGETTKIVAEVVKTDEKTGRRVNDICAICRAVYDNAKCLATRRDCSDGSGALNDKALLLKHQKEKIRGILKAGKCHLNDEYSTVASPSGEGATGALPKQVQDWVDGDGKLILRGGQRGDTGGGWQGNGWMGWSAILFAEPRLLCNKVSNKVVCQSFVEKMRRTMCLGDADETMENRMRHRLVTALDFGARGNSPDQTTARDACECATYCVPEVPEPTKGAIKQFLDSTLDTKKGLIAATHDLAWRGSANEERYREAKYREAMSSCIVEKPTPAPILRLLDAKNSKDPKDHRQQRWRENWKHEKRWTTKTPDHWPSSDPTNKSFDNGWPDRKKPEGEVRDFKGQGICDMSKGTGDTSPKLEGIFSNRVSYIGNCAEDELCFHTDDMSGGAPSETRLAYKPTDDEATPTLSVSDESSNAEVEQNRVRKNDYWKDRQQRFKAWGKAPEASDWLFQGVVYAELVRASNGMPKIIVVQGGIPKADSWRRSLKNLWQSAQSAMQISGPNTNDPRLVLELEDRDGTDMCMWLYHVCCAMGGQLHRDESSRDVETKDKMCPAGTICCPRTGGNDLSLHDGKVGNYGLHSGVGLKPVPWHEDTINLLRVLSHGKLKHTPRMNIDDKAQGWLAHDPISATGPATCHRDTQVLRSVFPDGEGTKQDSRQREKEHKEAAGWQCRFRCRESSGYLRTKSCLRNDGDKVEVTVDVAEKDDCSWTIRTAPAETAAMKQCELEQTGCGHTVKFLTVTPRVLQTDKGQLKARSKTVVRR